MKSCRLALAAFASMALAGCVSYNPLELIGMGSKPAHPPTPLTPITSQVTPRAIWSTPVGKSGGFAFRPDAEGGRIYAASVEGAITVIEEDSGRIFTRSETKKKLSGGVEVGDNKIFVATSKGEVIALDSTGKQAWVTSVAGEVISPPSVSRKVAVVRTSDGRIFGLSTEDGKRLWVFQRPAPSLLLRSEAGVVAIGGDVLAGYPNGKLIALDIDDGKLTWEVTVTQPRGTTDLERIADVAGAPIVDGNNVCAAAFQGKVACFEIQTRNMLWARDVSTARALARDNRYVYVVDDASMVHALDKSTGASVWKQDKLAYRKLTAPMVVDGRIVVGDAFGYVHVLSPEDGALVGRLATDGSAIESMIAAAGGVALQTAKGSVSLVRF
ncbi:MAG TPA: outer membrane protein assembly factor BamB [Usitatibacter sp.]|nr:outer membrane protein assembly factor BamB [Usitatibacter sp.]